MSMYLRSTAVVSQKAVVLKVAIIIYINLAGTDLVKSSW